MLSKDVPANTPIAEIERSLEVVEVPKDVRSRARCATSTTSTTTSSPPSTSRPASSCSPAASSTAARSPTSDVPLGLQEVTVALDPERAVGGDLKVGDTVGVVLSFDPFDTDVVRFDPANPFPVSAPDAASRA